MDKRLAAVLAMMTAASVAACTGAGEDAENTTADTMTVPGTDVVEVPTTVPTQDTVVTTTTVETDTDTIRGEGVDTTRMDSVPR